MLLNLSYTDKIANKFKLERIYEKFIEAFKVSVNLNHQKFTKLQTNETNYKNSRSNLALFINIYLIFSHRTGFANKLTFKLNSPLRFEMKSGKKVTPTELQTNKIEVIFVSGFLTKKVQPLFHEMVSCI